ncbi:hypothetical protein CORC01_13426 [Colletotrichum orchidophilum]|uniref:Uncharacterized protein n=1 Tax=Colletotrichum orchidophilum TaxID=1209926 RepID=A0A1G4AQ12_9PEZI|nr:uncharacterized protein CORC01_13426 [Colletotrichum orchidophilum]OHE91268.1 hypothetical protein CORC01_13426 [Colletotrichum orchidophilum]
MYAIMNTQTTTSTMTSCKSVAAESVRAGSAAARTALWPARKFLFQAATKLSHQRPLYTTGLAGRYIDDVNESSGFFDSGDDFCSVGDEQENVETQDTWTEDDCDEMLDILNERPQQLPVPIIILTNPEGEILTGDDIPQGNTVHRSREACRLHRQYVADVEKYLCPGNWKQIRDANRPQPRESWTARKALHQKDLFIVEQKSGKRHQQHACARHRDQNRWLRRQLEQAERLWQLQETEVGAQKKDRRARIKTLKRIGAKGDIESWNEEMDRQQEQAERTVAKLREELQEKMEMAFGAGSEDEDEE